MWMVVAAVEEGERERERERESKVQNMLKHREIENSQNTHTTLNERIPISHKTIATNSPAAL